MYKARRYACGKKLHPDTKIYWQNMHIQRASDSGQFSFIDNYTARLNKTPTNYAEWERKYLYMLARGKRTARIRNVDEETQQIDQAELEFAE